MNCEIVEEIPSYLQYLFPTELSGPVCLVKSTTQLTNHQDEQIRSKNTNFCLNETEDEMGLDVTGNPLEVDLNEDDTIVVEECNPIIQQWSENENEHFPVSITEARNYLNSKSIDRSSRPVFVICDGNNTFKTVIIGVQEFNKKIFTCTVNILGCFPKNHKKVTMDAMKKNHLLLMQSKKGKIDFVVTFKYSIFGTFLLHNSKDIIHNKFNGSISIENSVNKDCSLEPLYSIMDSMKIILQVIPGHTKSQVSFLWQDLALINNYLKIMSSLSIEQSETDISRDPLPKEDIYNMISEIVNVTLIRRELKSEFSLNNIRQPNIIDKLWKILIHCPDLQILRSAFHYFFEELAVSNNGHHKLPEDSTSNMATIINGILDGTLTVPTIICSQALKYLIEIGCEKLKNDYQTIIKQFYVYFSKEISSKWNELETKLSVMETHKKSRITYSLKGEKVNINNCLAKLTYLGNLHIVTEFIYLVKTGAFLPEQTFNYFCERVCKYYLIENCNKLEFKKLLEQPLCNFNIITGCADSNVVEGKIPEFYSVRMKSTKNNLEIESVYVLSKNNIFPTNIFNDYEIVGEDEDIVYYAYKMESRNVTVG